MKLEVDLSPLVSKETYTMNTNYADYDDYYSRYYYDTDMAVANND